MGGCASVNTKTVDEDLDNILYDNKRNVEAPIKVVDQLKVSYDCYGNRCLNEYTTLKFLGSGRYAEVRLCVNCLTGQKCAVKEMPRNLVYVQGNNIYEAQLLKNLNHPNIVKLYEVIDSPNEETVYLVFEYIDGGSVMKLDEDGNADRPALSEALCRNYLKQIVLGLEYLHSKQIVHQDIKPDNILISKDGSVVKLADFGVAKSFKTESAADLLKATVGSPAYYAPEICRGGYFSGKQADIWALGVTMYVFLYGTLPFKANGMQLFIEIQTNPVVLRDDLRMITKTLRDLLNRMLDKDILTRITLPEIQDHPWTNDLKENDQIITELSITTNDELFTTNSTCNSPLNVEEEICILVVDDVHMTRMLVEKLLKTLISKKVTIRIDAVPTGSQAIESCQSCQYKLIFMDIHMTCISGYEATTRIRENEKKLNQSRSRIVGMTADTQEGVFDRCLASGMDDLIMKPIRPSRMREVAYSVGIPIHSFNSVNDIELSEPLVKGHPLQVAWEQFLQKTGEMSTPSTPHSQVGTSPIHLQSSPT